jgi:hypothetical protein
MWARRTTSVLLLVLALTACGGSGLPTPSPATVTPSRGAASTATPIRIKGTGFSLRTVQPASGGDPSVEQTFLAWMGDRPLEAVRWVDEETLSATVPAGLTAGSLALRVQGPFGTSGDLAGAFTVDAPARVALAATIATQPARVNVGQSIAVTLTVTNTGTASATNVVPEGPTVTGTGTVGAPIGPSPASIATLAPGASGGFTWTYPATLAGSVAFDGSARMTDASGEASQVVTDPAHPARTEIDRPAALTASLPAAGSVAIGQEFTVVMTVVNGGGAGISDVLPGAPTATPEGMATLKGTGAVPASVALLAPGASATFTWTFVAAATSGTVRFSAGAAGADANSGAAVASGTVASGSFTIGTAGMLATLAALPATANVNQSVTLTLTVRNPGLADVREFTVGVPGVTPAGGATLSAGPSPAPPSILAAGQTVTTAWTFALAIPPGGAPGRLDFDVVLAGRDAFSGGPVTARPAASVTVQTPATVTATALSVGPSVLATGQAFAVALTVEKAGTARATITGASLTGATCTSPPAGPLEVTTTATLTWTGCTAPPTSQTLQLAASATWVDGNAPLAVRTTNVSVATVQVLQRAFLAAVFDAQPPSPVGPGQEVNLVVTVRNPAAAGGETAEGVGVTPIATRSTGTASGTCGVATPTLASIPAGGAQLFAFTCVPSGSGSLTFSAIATGTGAATGTGFSTEVTTGPPTVILAAASLVAEFATQPPSPVSGGHPVALTVNVLNTGGSEAQLVAVAPTFTAVTGTPGASCSAAAPGTATIPSGATQPFLFACTPSGSGILTFGAHVTGVAAGSGVALVATAATIPVTVQTPATVTVVQLVSAPRTVRLGATYALTLTLAKGGQAGASVIGASLTGPGVLCTPPVLPVARVGATEDLVWTACEPLGLPDPVPVVATVTWVDSNVPGSPVTTAPFDGTIQVR